MKLETHRQYRRAFTEIQKYSVNSIKPHLCDGEAYIQVELSEIHNLQDKIDLEEQLTLISNENIEFVSHDCDIIFKITNL